MQASKQPVVSIANQSLLGFPMSSDHDFDCFFFLVWEFPSHGQPTTGLAESLVKFQVTSPWGSRVKLSPGHPPGSPLVLPPGLKYPGCLATLSPLQLPPLGQRLGVNVLCKMPSLVLAMCPQVATDLSACSLNLDCHSAIFQALGGPGHHGIQVKI